jgi:hypothetical protein
MSPDSLRHRVVEQFRTVGLLQSIHIAHSAFRELPRMFEVSHLAMRLVVEDIAAVAAASNVALGIKHELASQGVELEYEICAQWQVFDVVSENEHSCTGHDWIPPDAFDLEVTSGHARRFLSIHVSAEAYTCIRRYLRHISPAYRVRAICKLLKACVNRKLSTYEEEYWDPVLYPSRILEGRDVTRILGSRINIFEPNLSLAF